MTPKRGPRGAVAIAELDRSAEVRSDSLLAARAALLRARDPGACERSMTALDRPVRGVRGDRAGLSTSSWVATSAAYGSAHA